MRTSNTLPLPAVRSLSDQSTGYKTLRAEYVYSGVLLCVILVYQFRLPLDGFTANLRHNEMIFRNPTALRASPEQLKQYVEMDHIFLKDAADEGASHDSHDAIRVDLDQAIFLFQEYQAVNSHHRMEEEEESCHERTNRGSDDSMQDIIDDGQWCPELHERHYLVVDWVDPCNESHNPTGRGGLGMLEDFVRSMAWGMLTKRTILFREVSPSSEPPTTSTTMDHSADDDSCDGDECTKRYDLTECKGMAKLDPWVPFYTSWKKEYGWEDSVIEDMSVQKLIELLAAGRPAGQSDDEDNDGTPKVIHLKSPPPISADLLQDHPTLLSAAKPYLEFKNLYGMLFDETVLLKEPDLDSWDSVDGEENRTRRYVVHAGAARKSGCALTFEQPCVIYQIGSEALNPSACSVEMVTKEKDLNSYAAIFDIFALSGQAFDGVVLDADLAVHDLLMEFLQYRGGLDEKDFTLAGCWDEKR